ncbi:HNH endonuclease signature motif containing protein [Aromatoleum anaerobium]|uniref:HNH endonuclease n=1 Tax=Aromatoleum anaerobium TaxID=182180 RepID=A0ABX1PTI1_9RHOO|nr:HNH endonuclease signature motif containing protein [Aromatoleum anaerobium]MCK0507935.1 HNH endonuclease [Aromatoleum anaerobium]
MKIVDEAKYLAKRRATLFANAIRKEIGCVEFQGYADKVTGYGYSKFFGKTVYAHRLAWELDCGPIPDGLQINHTCDNKLCINTAHMYLGTHLDNMSDAKERARFKRFRGEQNAQAKLTEMDVMQILGDRRTHHSIAAEFGVSRSAVQIIKAGKRWRHVQQG